MAKQAVPSDASLMSHFSVMRDPRIDRTKIHKLSDILVIAISAVISGAEGWTEIEEFGRSKEQWFASFLDLPGGIPSHDTFGRVFARLDPLEFQKCFISWMDSVREVTEGEVVALDGKTLRASADRANGKHALHSVSAWAGSNNLTLGHIGGAEKKGELQSMTALLNLLDVKGCIVTIDAAGCHRSMAEAIQAAEGDYVLALKANQPTLHDDTIAYFATCRERSWSKIKHSYFQQVEGDHGRIETRRCWAIAPAGKIRDWELWPGLRSLVLVERTRECKGTSSTNLYYYVSSLVPDAALLLAKIREHWGIENRVHWILDVAMNEDACRIRKDHSAENFATLRRIALNLVKNEKTVKRGVKTRQRKAGWDNDYLLRIILN